MRNTVAVLSMFAVAAAAWACSSSSSSGAGGGGDDGGSESGSGSGGGVDATIDVVDNPANCVKPGTASNSQGVGGYCNSGGAQCTSAGPGGAPTLCSSDFDGVANAWFCTITCDPSTNCGSNATCTATTGGSYCVPAACLGVLADAGALATDAGTQHEAGLEGGSDDGPAEGSAGDSAVQDGAQGDGQTAD